jgi:NTP pyrophosphatase (non-canonical NTP hydrolase)
MPSVEHGIMFMMTEVAEACEQWLAQFAYVRHNPQDKEPYALEKFAQELGDVIFMAIITGRVVGVDPVEALLEKLSRKLREQGLEDFGNLDTVERLAKLLASDLNFMNFLDSVGGQLQIVTQLPGRVVPDTIRIESSSPSEEEDE